jgi:hypothetical protein
MPSLIFERYYYPSAKILCGGDAFGLTHPHARPGFLVRPAKERKVVGGGQEGDRDSAR